MSENVNKDQGVSVLGVSERGLPRTLCPGCAF